MYKMIYNDKSLLKKVKTPVFGRVFGVGFFRRKKWTIISEYSEETINKREFNTPGYA